MQPKKINIVEIPELTLNSNINNNNKQNNGKERNNENTLQITANNKNMPKILMVTCKKYAL